MILDNLQDLINIDIDGDDFEDKCIDFLLNEKQFISFADGLSNIMGNPQKPANHLTKLLRNHDLSNPSDQTIRKWFNSDSRPNYDPQHRDNIFKICFALQLSIEETEQFLKEVYLDHGLNFRDIKDIAYYIALKKGESYQMAQNYLNELSNVPHTTTDKTLPTKTLHAEIKSLATFDEVKQYVLEHGNNMSKYNVTASKTIDKLLEVILVTSEDATLLRNPNDTTDITSFTSIFAKILFVDAQNEAVISTAKALNDRIEKQKVQSIKFFLSTLIMLDPQSSQVKSTNKNKEIINELYRNFPDAKSISTILENSPKSKEQIKASKTLISFSRMRKPLILLHFYKYWSDRYIECSTTQNIDTYEYFDDIEDIVEDYTEDIDNFLNDSGMPMLSSHNPYDKIFILCSYQSNPLQFFSALISCIFI